MNYTNTYDNRDTDSKTLSEATQSIQATPLTGFGEETRLLNQKNIKNVKKNSSVPVAKKNKMKHLEEFSLYNEAMPIIRNLSEVNNKAMHKFLRQNARYVDRLSSNVVIKKNVKIKKKQKKNRYYR